MTIQALATGTVSTPPTSRTTAAGRPWATFTLRVQAGGSSSSFVSVAVFAPDLVDAVLALAEGAAISVQGRLELREWTGRDGQSRTGLSITASELMALKAPEPRQRASKPAVAPREVPFGPEAGDLDSVLPRGVVQ
jgi:single-stranded DNA-binding protein